MIAASDADGIVGSTAEAPDPVKIGTAAVGSPSPTADPAGFSNVSGRMLGRPATSNPAG